MLDKKTVRKRLDDTRKTLRNLTKRKELRIEISKKSLMGYCNETIILCEMILVLLKKKKMKNRANLNPICFGKYEKERNVCFQCVWRSPCIEKTSS